MVIRNDFRTYTYEIDNGFFVDVIIHPIKIKGKREQMGAEAYVYHEDYGVKEMVVGVLFNSADFEQEVIEFMSGVEAMLDCAIQSYKSTYINETNVF